jgi:hypothetical protein
MHETFAGAWLTENYGWEGDTAKFRLFEGQLQLWDEEKGNALIALYGVPPGINQWCFTVRNDYAGTTANYLSLYLWSRSAVEKKEALYVRLGYTKKNVSLCARKETGKVEVLIEGRTLFEEPQEVEIKVEATAEGLFTLLSRTAQEPQFVQEGTATLTLPRDTGYFMIGMTYSAKHGQDKFVDEVTIARFASTAEEPVLPPEEPVPPAEEPVPPPEEPVPPPEEPVPPAEEPEKKPVAPEAGMLIISEVMADPKGAAGLPETEYVEVCNLSEHPLMLTGCALSYSGRKVDLGGGSLAAGQYMVVYRSGKAITIERDGIARGLDNFPAQLINTGKGLSILDAKGQVIDSVWYPQAKAGQSWERENDRWYISSDAKGGTPGAANSLPKGEKVPVLPAATEPLAPVDTASSVEETEALSVAVLPPTYDSARKLYVIDYEVDRIGYQCRFFVYDLEGHRRATLPISNLWNLQGKELWDGCDEHGRRLPYGIYIFYGEVYHREGVVRHFKQSFLVHPLR